MIPRPAVVNPSGQTYGPFILTSGNTAADYQPAAGWKRQPLRVAFRLAALITAVFCAFADYLARVRLAGRDDCALARARWSRRWCLVFLRTMGVEITRAGTALPPTAGLLVSNHQSYLDSLVLCAATPVVLVAKDDIRDWPLAGLLARCSGSIFINRRKRSDVLRVIRLFPSIVHDSAPVGFFPEATCTDGRALLPFRSSLFAPAVRHGWSVTPARIDYSVDDADGPVETEVCWWGGMAFLPHFLNLLAKRQVRARLAYGAAETPGNDRKKLARRLQERVHDLGNFR